MKWSIQRKIGTAFGAAAILLIAVFVLIDQGRRKQVDSRKSVLHTEDVLGDLSLLSAKMTEAEAAGRGYLITRESAYLEAYESAVGQIEPALASLSKLIVDQGRLQRLSQLRQAVRAHVQSDEAVLEVHQKRGSAAATRAFVEADSPQEMDKIHAMIRDMGDEERKLLVQRENRLQATDRLTTLASLASRSLVLILLAVAYILFSRDAARRQSLQQELMRKNAELEGANRHKSEFLANMSHELRTPLNAVIGYTGTLLMRLPGPLNADQEKQLKTVQTSARHLLSLINDLLDLAKIESGKVDVKLEEISCREIIEQIITTLRPIAQAKSLSLEAKLPNGAVVAKTDRRAISQILINLTNNGIKFTDKGSVRLELSEKTNGGPAMAAIEVVDTGPGIRPEDQARLFRAFEQLGPSRPREGTGLGLFVSGRLASLIGARIEFTSELGKGSRFTVLIPKA